MSHNIHAHFTLTKRNERNLRLFALGGNYGLAYGEAQYYLRSAIASLRPRR
ncbi:hypothetical protein [Bifidobacterium felsineum]|uniref:hypothetical protein n=1 Tax=Bifidobacterium felsineum TaxID=2045440 RepID=UPI001BDDA6BD|nr:hypothetical protein [Bifidobacterium felsineum]MBT1163786.1 hypothetical protein [Bifidobacterium felsineum]